MRERGTKDKNARDLWYCREFDLSHKSRRFPNPAYFHIVIDCMVPIYGTVNEWLLKQKLPKVESTNSSEPHDCILVDDVSERLIDQLNVPHAIKVHTRYDPDMTYCIHEKATLIYDYLGKSYKMRRYGEERLFSRWMRGNLTSMSSAPLLPALTNDLKIVVTNRLKLRTIDNFDFFVKKLEAFFGRENITTYNEKTTFEKTVSLFSGHNVFIHFHGAAGANAIFMPPNSLVVEISTFADYESANKQWRSNARVSRVHDNLTWVVYSVPLSQINVNEGDVLKAESGNELLHYMPSLRLTSFDINNIINIVVGTKTSYPYEERNRRRFQSY